MKKKIIHMLLIVVTIVSCTTMENEKLGDEDIARIKEELKQKVELIVQSSEERSVDKLSEVYWDNEDFLLLRENGMITYDKLMESEKKSFATLNDIKFDEAKYTYRFIDPETVIVIYEGGAKLELKDSSKMEINPFKASLLFKKIKNEWKAIFSTEHAKYNSIKIDSTQND